MSTEGAEDREIYKKVFTYIAEERPYTVNPKYCVNGEDKALMSYLFASMTPPIQPELCFYKKIRTSSKGIYSYRLFQIFSDSSPSEDFEICPFGCFDPSVVNKMDVNDTLPFTVLLGDNIIQAYGITRAKGDKTTQRISNPTAAFKERLISGKKLTWDCGHMQDVADTFPTTREEIKLSCHAQRENLSPQSVFWNRYSRNHLIKRIRSFDGGGYYATFPSYFFHHLHNRKIANGKWIPDGEFLQTRAFRLTSSSPQKQLFIPNFVFTSPKMTVNFNLGRSLEKSPTSQLSNNTFACFFVALLIFLTRFWFSIWAARMAKLILLYGLLNSRTAAELHF